MTNSRPIMLVTGGSRGIGRATAVLAAERGYSVGIGYHSNAEAAQEVAEQCQQLGAQTTVICADMANPEDVKYLFATLDSELGVLDVLINNAGVLEQSMRLDTMSAERIARIMAVNVTGALLCAKEAVLRMSSNHGGKGGAIVNVSSRASVLGSANEFVDYAASKGAVDTFTIGLANELGAEGIRVNAVRPGLIETRIHSSAGHPDRVDKLKHNVPMQRGGSAVEVAEAILWLASDKSSYTTGSLLDVSGGR